jgi:hypothetical protein
VGAAMTSRLARVSPRLRLDARDGGYAAVDAMVALLIIALTIVLSLQAVLQARRSAAMADEIRGAQVLMARLLDSGPRSFSPAAGTTNGFSWRLETAPTGLDRPIALCHRGVTLNSAATGRTFKAGTLETCPDEPIA